MKRLAAIIESGFEQAGSAELSDELRQAVERAMALLDTGEVRVAEKTGGEWLVNQWLKKAVLLSFRLSDSELIPGSYCNFFDKVPLKYAGFDQQQFEQAGVRVVPDALVRHGAHVARDVILMPSYINVGAYVDCGTLVDTWATVGSCAQIGRNVHISGGVGIGGVLEPIQAGPTIIEDDCFIGARSEVVEGVIVEKGSVLSMGVFIEPLSRLAAAVAVADSEYCKRHLLIPLLVTIHSGRFSLGSFRRPASL